LERILKGYSMVNLKFLIFFITICHETFLFVLFLKEYKKMVKKKNFEIALML